MNHVLALQAIPEIGTDAAAPEAAVTTMGSYISVFNDCTGERSVWCSLTCNN